MGSKKNVYLILFFLSFILISVSAFLFYEFKYKTLKAESTDVDISQLRNTMVRAPRYHYAPKDNPGSSRTYAIERVYITKKEMQKGNLIHLRFALNFVVSKTELEAKLFSTSYLLKGKNINNYFKDLTVDGKTPYRVTMIVPGSADLNSYQSMICSTNKDCNIALENLSKVSREGFNLVEILIQDQGSRVVNLNDYAIIIGLEKMTL